MSLPGWPAVTRGLTTATLLALGISMPVRAQVVSQGRGQLTFMVGQGSGPLGAIASDIVDQHHTTGQTNQKHAGFRIMGGYQFADHVSFEAGITHLGTFVSQVPYLTSDQLLAQTNFDAIEANLVGKIPFAPDARLDVTVGAVRTALSTSISTLAYSALPSAQANPVNVRHYGVDLAADVEWRLSERTSLIVGYHAYPGVGSSRLIGSANGTMSIIAGGIHFEF